MKVEKGNVMDYIGISDIVCVTTNGVVKKNGELVMGPGCARSFKERFPQLSMILGEYVSKYGNECFIAGKCRNTYIVSFPTKNHFKEKSDINLIKKSAEKLVMIVNELNAKDVRIPSPGTGLGGLSKSYVYNPLMDILDDRFIIMEL